MSGNKLNLSLKIDSNVFSLFTPFSSDDVKERIDGSVLLLEYLAKRETEEKDLTERDYALKRIVRGLGGSTCTNKTVYFTALVGLLKGPCNATLNIEDVVEVMEKELRIGKEIKKKEDSDAIIGRILLCGALIRSNKLDNATNDALSKCINILAEGSRFKMVHSSLAYTFLIELLSKLSSEKFQKAMWPIMTKELRRPWEQHNLNTVYFLLAVFDKYPDIIDTDYLESSIKTSEILSPLSFKHLGRLFWGNTSMQAITHPAYDELAQFLSKCKSKPLTTFWRHEVDECLAAPTKLKEIVTIKILKDIINCGSFDTKTLMKLLSDRFIKMMVNSLRNAKQKKLSYLFDYYDEFFESVNKHMSKITDENEKVAIISKFILHPGALSIEKYTRQNIIRQMITRLGSDGVMKMTVIYKNVFIGQLSKDPTDAKVKWLNFEKQYSAQMMLFLVGLKIMQNEIDWRIEQSKFMACVSLFYISSEGVPVTAENDNCFITKDLWMNMKNIFYSSLHVKLPNLKNQMHMLLTLVQFCNEILSKKKRDKYLREPLSVTSVQSWKKMYQFVTSPKGTKKIDQKLDLIFRILFMHMGLQLFKEPEMAELAIVDLEKCMEKISGKKITSQKLKSDDEPQWIEVVVDIFLHLLSKNNKFLKVVVNGLFPYLCSTITLTAVNQILSVLDMKISNPLSNANDGDESDDEENELNDGNNEQSSADDDDGEAESFSKSNGVASSNEDESDEEDESGEEDEDEMDEDEGTVTDQLRNAISTVLATTSDAESVDLNDMTEEEGKRLDENLSAVFKSIKQPNSKKKTKKERTIATTVMHFRIRVLELIEIYLKSAQSMEICLEIMLALFNMTEFCIESDVKPLSDRIDKVLMKLSNLRNFEDATNVEEENICKLLTELLNRKVNPIKVEMYNKLLSKCVAFMVCSLPLVSGADNSVLTAIKQYALEFLNTRNPRMTFTLLKDIFNMRWTGVWSIALSLSECGFSSKNQNIRSFRRCQLFELLGNLYKNHGFIKANIKSIDKENGKIVGLVTKYLHSMQQIDKVPPKEFLSLVSLLCEMQKCSKSVSEMKLNENVNWQANSEKVQNIRRKVNLMSLESYQTYCRLVGIKLLKKCDVQTGHQNGHVEEIDEEITTKEAIQKVKKHKKRKIQETSANVEQETRKENKKQKKLNKEERLRIASEGLNGISFSSVSIDDVNMQSSSDSE